MDSTCKVVVTTDGVYRGSKAVTLKANADRVRCYALDGAGERKGEVPVQAGPEGAGAKIVIGPDYQTVWYEIIVR